MRIISRQILYILSFAAITGFVVNIIHPRGYEFISRVNISREHIININAAEAYIKYTHGAAVFIDSRDQDIYQEGHIRGALNIPSSPEPMSNTKIGESMAILFSEKELVMYCDAGCDSSKKIAERLFSRGYTRHIYILKDGIGSWSEKGYPVE